jgi:hypothetical protein
MERLRIKLLTIGVLSASANQDIDYAIENELEFLLSPGEDPEILYGLDWDFDGEYTNEYWHLVPKLEEECDLDEDRVWQQIVWCFEGDFEIPNGMSPVEAVSKVGWELSVRHRPDGISLDEFYWHIVDAERVAS